ncbi:hypothetical protein [Nocardioides flavescens]|uniref:Uncharacterized protein n=1 Tax=Nocardioides flavescens TaxID=2691959 RepID=A0A6L7F080_9ACTN|nr:hypothetical protein [Nocardioides flavescens]MXG88114.1 hypothetical protein [Nocardioides flavescens]
MGFTDRLGGMARAWVHVKTTELITTDRSVREDAGLRSDQVEHEARVGLGDQAVRTALPGLADAAERQAERRRLAEAEQVAAEQSELRALPRAQVSLRSSGTADGAVDAELPLRWEEVDGELLVEVLPLADARPVLDGHELTRLAFLLPEPARDGTWDLAAVYAARRASGLDDLLDWGLELGDDGESAWWFDPGAGPSTLTLADDCRRVSLALSLSGAAGRATVTAEITRAVPAAPL